MSIVRMNAPEPSPLLYDEVVDRYAIDMLKVPGDLVIRNGDIAISKSCDLMLNDEVYSALYRLVQAWRFTSPSLTVLFGLFENTKRKEKEFEQTLNMLRPVAGTPFLSSADRAEYHEANDQISAAQLAMQSYAGAVLLIVNSFLLAFRDDTEISRSDWEKAGPLLGGCSVGAFIEAAANNFRHEDEWMKTQIPTKRQLASIRVLEAA